MLVINYNGNKPIADHYKYSVSGNNDVDCIRFCLSKEQDGLVLEQDYSYYANVRCVDDDFYDKVLLNNVEINSEDNSVVVLFYLQKIHTSHKQIEVSLSVESNDNEAWHTQAVKISINNGVDCDDEIVNNYPTILQQLQAQINELSGGIKEVEISKIYLKNQQEQPILTMNKIIDAIDGERYTNDASGVLVVIETTPINTTIEQKIKDGVFVIRFNHCVKYSKKGYRHCVGDRLKEFEQGLIFVDKDMIYPTSNGKKYIKVEMSFLDFYNKFYSINEYPNVSATNLQSLAQNKYRSILSTIFMYQNGDFEQEYYHTKLGGYPMYESRDFNRIHNASHFNLPHIGNDDFTTQDQNQNPKPKPMGLNTKYNFYSFVFYNGVSEENPLRIENHFIRKTRKKFFDLEWNGESETYDSDYINRYAPTKTGKLTRRLMEMALQPSCAILNPNYKTMTEQENVWEESFKKSQQTITMSLGSFLYISINNIATRGYLFIPRIRISPKK